MRKKIVLALALAAAVLSAQPRFTVENRDHDFGLLEQGDRVVRHTFVLRNTGTDTLRLSNVRPCCASRIAEFDAAIAPGRTGRIVAEFNMRGRTGRLRYNIMVHTNDPDNAQTRLTMTAFVRTPLDIVQRWMNLQARRGRITGTVSFLAERDDLVVNSAFYIPNNDNSDSTALNMVFSERVGPDENGNYRFDFNFDFARTVSRFESGTLVFNTNVTGRPSVSANVSIEPSRDDDLF